MEEARSIMETRPTPYSDEQLKRIAEAWTPIIRGINDWFQQVASAMQSFLKNWFPVISQAHRSEVKRVHTAYRVRQKARRRRRRG